MKLFYVIALSITFLVFSLTGFFSQAHELNAPMKIKIAAVYNASGFSFHKQENHNCCPHAKIKSHAPKCCAGDSISMAFLSNRIILPSDFSVITAKSFIAEQHFSSCPAKTQERPPRYFS